MIWLVVVMLLILLAAAAVVVYVAYPYRDETVPRAPWLGEAMRRGVESIPLPREDDEGREDAGESRPRQSH